MSSSEGEGAQGVDVVARRSSWLGSGMDDGAMVEAPRRPGAALPRGRFAAVWDERRPRGTKSVAAAPDFARMRA